MSIFAFYFASNLLRLSGWPRKLGRFKGEGYDATMVDLVWGQAIDWGAALGAARPRLALQMIAEMYRDRDSESAPDLKMFVDGVRSYSRWAAGSPQEAVPPPKFSAGMQALTVDQWTGPQTRSNMEQQLLLAILWGLSNPERFAAWYGRHTAELASNMPAMRAAGIEIDEPQSFEDFVEGCEEIVREYENEINALPAIPQWLIADAQALGWDVPTL